MVRAILLYLWMVRFLCISCPVHIYHYSSLDCCKGMHFRHFVVLICVQIWSCLVEHVSGHYRACSRRRLVSQAALVIEWSCLSSRWKWRAWMSYRALGDGPLIERQGEKAWVVGLGAICLLLLRCGGRGNLGRPVRIAFGAGLWSSRGRNSWFRLSHWSSWRKMAQNQPR